MEGSPWSFKRRALVMSRLKEGENPHCVELNTMDLWVQVYDLKAGFMAERILREVGNYIGKFVASAPSNFVGVWRDYLRVRVTIDVTKPLKRRMKIKSAGKEWFWISFKYENVPTFCFICGILGHAEKYCSQLFVVPEKDIVRPYGDFMRAPFKRQVKQIGAKWLRSGMDSSDRNMNSGEKQNQNERGSDNQDPSFTPTNQGVAVNGEKHGKEGFQKDQMGGILEIRNQISDIPIIQQISTREEVMVVETKKRKTKETLGLNELMDCNSETMMDSEDVLDQTSPDNQINPKNVKEASAQESTRLGL